MRVVIAVVALGALGYSACGNMAAAHAASIASQQHGCPRDRVHVIGEGGNWTYWLDVCGRRRLYDTRGGAYRDVTNTVE